MNQETDALETTTLENVTLWPLEPSGRRIIKLRLSPEVPNVFEHFQFRKGQKLNVTSTRPPKKTPSTSLITGTSLYAGIIFVPFGHFIAESIHRLWPIYTDPAMLEVRLVFHVWHGASFIIKTGIPDWMREIFDILGIAQSRLTVIGKPLSFEKLVVPTQGSLLGIGPLSPQYEAVFPPQSGADKESSIVPGRRIYVSRSEYLFSGSYLGEPLVERILERDGKFEILHPQNHAVAEVLQKLQSCETAVFAEGSALHLLELCRRRPSNVFVICRRHKGAAKFFIQMLQRMVCKVEFHPVVSELGPLDFSKRGHRPAGYNAPALVDIASLVRRLADFCGIELQEPTEAEIRQAQALSLLRYVLDPRSTAEWTTHANLGGLLTKLRTQVSNLDMLPWSQTKKLRGGG
jgi:hypothetical protein